MSGIVSMAHRADHPDGPFKTVSEVAEYFERDKDTIRRWGKTLGIPTHKMELCEPPKPFAFVWLYTEKDIEQMERYMETLNPKGGRPRKNAEQNS